MMRGTDMRRLALLATLLLDWSIVAQTQATPLKLQYRVCDEHGAELADERVVSALRDRHSSRAFEVRTGSHGELDIDVDAAWLAEAEVPLLMIYRRDERGELTEYAGAFAVELGKGLVSSAKRESVKLLAEPVLVSGRVVDAEGRGLAGIVVEAPSTFTLETKQSSWGGGARSLGHRVETEANGDFALRELRPKGVAFELRSGTRGLVLAEPALVTPGQTGLRLVAVGAASLRAGLKDAEDVALGSHLQISVRETRTGTIQTRSFERAREVEFTGLRPGTHEVLLGDALDPDLVIENVKLVAGQPCADPRVAEIDWTGALRKVAVSVRKPAGSGLVVTCFIMHVLDHGMRGHGFAIEDEAVVLVPKRRGGIQVSAPGHVTEQAVDPGDRVLFTLVAQPELQLRLPADVTLPAGLDVRLEVPTGRPGARTSYGRRIEAATTASRPMPMCFAFDSKATTGTVSLVRRDGRVVWNREISWKRSEGPIEVTLPLTREDAARLSR